MIPLLKGHFVSDMAVKELPKTTSTAHDVAYNPSVATTATTHYNVFEFYVMFDYGLMVPLRQLKLSTLDEKSSSELKRIIALNAN